MLIKSLISLFLLGALTVKAQIQQSEYETIKLVWEHDGKRIAPAGTTVKPLAHLVKWEIGQITPGTDAKVIKEIPIDPNGKTFPSGATGNMWLKDLYPTPADGDKKILVLRVWSTYPTPSAWSDAFTINLQEILKEDNPPSKIVVIRISVEFSQ